MSNKNIQMISSRKEIKEILEKGKHLSGKYLKLIFIKESNLEPQLKLLISIPKKKIKLAVHRNKIRRKIKGFFLNKKEVTNVHVKVIIIYKHLKPVKYLKLEKDMLFLEKLVFDI